MIISITERNLKSPSLMHWRIASLLRSFTLALKISLKDVIFIPLASLIIISWVIDEAGSSGKIAALTWKVRWRRLRQLILSPMRIALRGKVPTLPNKKLILTLQTLLDQENAIPNHSQIRVHCFLFHSKPEKRFFSGE